MKRMVLTATLVIACVAADSAAQRDDRISLFTDDRMSSCGLAMTTSGIYPVYLFHLASQPATASRFSAPKPPCWFNATWLADVINPAYLAYGNTQSDISIAYMGYTTGCSQPPISLGRIDYFFAGGLSPACCEYDALPAAGAPSIQIVDCSFEEFTATSGTGVIINPNANCQCELGPQPVQPTRIEMFASEDRSSCKLTDNGNGLQSVYLFQTGDASGTAVQFKARIPDCWTGATWVADRIATPYLSLGNSQSDLSVAYTRCEEPPILIARIDYFSTGQSSPCCNLEITAAPHTDGVTVVGCDFAPHIAEVGHIVVVNETAACPCGEPATDPVSVEKTTWGRIKAMYR